MSIKNAVVGIVLAAFASQAAADMPDGKGGRMGPQAAKSQVAASAARRCCEKASAPDAKPAIEPRVPPQRSAVIATPQRCKHMPSVAGAVETRVPPQRVVTAPEPATHCTHACCHPRVS